MAMVCPKCSGTYDQALQCPVCDERLLYHAKLRRSTGPTQRPESPWRHSPWGRLIVGIILSQGLAHGLELLLTAGVLAASDQGPGQLWTTLLGLVMLQVVYGISLLISGALTAAGQRNGIVLGAVVGMASGVLFLIVRRFRGEAMNEVVLYGQPLLNLILGSLGGLIGSLIWKPLPLVEVTLPKPDKSAPQTAPRASLWSGPIHWRRVLAGIVIVIIGVVWPKAILDLVLSASNGQLSVDNALQAQLVTWEICGLTTLIGAAFAGATTRNGLKQGLVVGLGASIVLIGNRLGSARGQFDQTIFLVLSILLLALVGAWFGCQLFPPIAAGRRRGVRAH